MSKRTPLLATVGLSLAFTLLSHHSAPADDTMDWLLQKATTAPTTRQSEPATRPELLAQKNNPEARNGRLVLSTGKSIVGRLATTREKPIRIWVDAAKEYRDVPFALIKSIQAKVLWERDEKEWHFIESGSDIKEYTGKTYPARELQYTVTLFNGQTITGGIVAPIYLTSGEDTRTYVLYKRQKGEVGASLRDLGYVQRIDFADALSR